VKEIKFTVCVFYFRVYICISGHWYNLNINSVISSKNSNGGLSFFFSGVAIRTVALYVVIP